LILDSSAIIAVLLREPTRASVEDLLAREPSPGVGAPTVVETGVVLVARAGVTARTTLARFLLETGSTVIPFGDTHWPVALDAFDRFGKGRHPAALNFGDCMTYAIARLADEPLVCTGDDFAKTDLTLAA
jgi:ribonuclease VapC